MPATNEEPNPFYEFFTFNRSHILVMNPTMADELYETLCDFDELPPHLYSLRQRLGHSLRRNTHRNIEAS